MTQKNQRTRRHLSNTLIFAIALSFLPWGLSAKEEQESEEKHLKLTTEQLEAAGIELTKVGPALIRETMPLYGLVAPNAERIQTISARFPGIVRSVSKRVGDPVKNGEALATVESSDSLKAYPLVSSISGVITERNTNIGEQATDKTLFVVADLSTLWVELSLFPRDWARVKIGQQVRVRNFAAELQAEGKIISIAPIGSSVSQTLIARVLLDNANRDWTPGLFVTAEVTLTETQVPQALRNNALHTNEGLPVVFIKTDDGFEPRPVKLGRTDGESSEVLAGLTAGDTYATKNSFILKSELGKGEAEDEE